MLSLCCLVLGHPSQLPGFVGLCEWSGGWDEESLKMKKIWHGLCRGEASYITSLEVSVISRPRMQATRSVCMGGKKVVR